MNIASIAVIGVGGVGGFFGGKLCQLQNHGTGFNISFVARGRHLQAIRESGLLLSTESDGELVCKPGLATNDFQRLPPLDLCLICVKEFDLAAVLSQLEPRIADDTIVLPLLNGVDVYSRVRTVIENGVVMPACVYVGTHIERPGRIVQKGGACKILFGPDPKRQDFAPHEVVKVFDQAGIQSEWTPSIQAEIWKKFMFICAYGLVSAAHGKTLGEILENDVLRGDVQAIMTEINSLAMGSGVCLPDDIVEMSLSKARHFPFEAKTSFQRDFELMNRKDERNLFVGSMIRIADELRIEVPRTRAVSSLLAKRKPAWP